MNLHRLGAVEIRRLVVAKDVCAHDVTTHFLDRIAARDGDLGAFLSVDREAALSGARACDERLARGEAPRMLEGVPVAVKDNIVTADLPTTCGSRQLTDFHAGWDAEVVRRIRVAGGIIIGKTNLDEFGMGSSGEHSAYFPTRNPHDRDRVPGGSSSGSAAAVAARLAPLALGTDTGGSVRQPAAFCGIAGLKPTWGRVSRNGLVAFASSFDQIGPMARDLAGLLLLWNVLLGEDPGDATSILGEVPAQGRRFNPGAARIGLVPAELAGVDAPCRAAVLAAADNFTNAGARIIEIDLPHREHALAAYYLLANAEASSNLARFDGIRYGNRVENSTAVTRARGFGKEVKRRILLGTHALKAGYADRTYHRAARVRAKIAGDFANAFQQVDFLLGPTTPGPAFRLGEKSTDPAAMYLSDALTTPQSVAGLPALSIPGNRSAGGLPVGLQLTGPALSEPALLAAGRFLEQKS